MGLSVILAISCLYLSYVLYVKKPSKSQQNNGAINSFLYNSYYLNELYDAVFVRPIHKFSVALWKYVDVIIIDGAVLLFGRASNYSGKILRVLQSGRLEHYLIAFLGAMVVMAAWIVGRLL
jgi:NADH-quinone oxidoreductase subunit L